MLRTQRTQRAETTMAQTPEFKDFIPGMEFFQTLLKGSGMPSQFANWVAPTLDVEEIEQKITDLKAVLSWLETNARMTQNMIQALEVQRMTLHALKSMNVDLQSFAKGMVAEPSPKETVAAQGAQATSSAEAQRQAESATTPLFDPMQWWNTMTQQFTELATKAMQEGTAAPDAAAKPAREAGKSATTSTSAAKSAAKPTVKPAAKKTARSATKRAGTAAKSPR
jgi:superfamily I DNA/RNA helicase